LGDRLYRDVTSGDGWLGEGHGVGLACHVGVGLWQVGGTLGLVQGEPAWWWNDVVEVVMELESQRGRAGWGLCAMLG